MNRIFARNEVCENHHFSAKVNLQYALAKT